MEKVVEIDGVEVKAGSEIAITNWLTFKYRVVDVVRSNKLLVKMGEPSKWDMMTADTLTKCHNGGWKLNGHSRVSVDFKPNEAKIKAHNDVIESSERWMCM